MHVIAILGGLIIRCPCMILRKTGVIRYVSLCHPSSVSLDWCIDSSGINVFCATFNIESFLLIAQCKPQGNLVLLAQQRGTLVVKVLT